MRIGLHVRRLARCGCGRDRSCCHDHSSGLIYRKQFAIELQSQVGSGRRRGKSNSSPGGPIGGRGHSSHRRAQFVLAMANDLLAMCSLCQATAAAQAGAGGFGSSRSRENNLNSGTGSNSGGHENGCLSSSSSRGRGGRSEAGKQSPQLTSTARLAVSTLHMPLMKIKL